MKILVFIKQVPDTADIRFDERTKTLVREGVASGINPYDRRALSEAIRLKTTRQSEVVVATMGPPQAVTILQEALLIGADRVVHIQDSRLAGSDTLVTAHVLAAAARKIGFDLLMCGQHSTDSETGQVAPELGELLGVPCAVAVKRMEYQEETIRAFCETDEGTTVVDLPLPAIVSTAERLIKPIKIKGADLSLAPPERIERWNLEDLHLSAGRVGITGSPTRVVALEDRSITRQPQLWDGTDTVITARQILDQIRTGQRKRTASPQVPVSFVQGDRQYWCWIERTQDQIRRASLELLSGAASLAAQTGGMVRAVWAGRRPEPDEIRMLSMYGADEICHAYSAGVHPDEIVSLLCERISSLRPFALFFPATSQGKVLAPRIAARLQLGLVGDCVGLKLDSTGQLIHLKPAYGGNIAGHIYCNTHPQLATIRPGALPLLSPRMEKEIPLQNWSFPYNVPHQYHILSHETDAGLEASKLDSARVIVGVGMGLGRENVSMAYQLADLLDGAVGGTRRVVDSGWMPRQSQIGLTGKFVAPDFYLGFGISGRYNHTIGIQRSGTIFAINNDSNAEILGMVDVGIVGDCVQIMTQMIKALESR